MNAKVLEKHRAIELRKSGYSYKNILKEVSVAKSTLSSWLKDLPLTDAEKQYLKHRTDSNISRGRIKAATSNRKRRLDREKVLFVEAKAEFESFLAEHLFHTGVALYWAEGTKRSTQFQFSNSDPNMINVMLSWIETFLKVNRRNIKFRLYMHKPYAHENWEQFWADKLNVSLSNFSKTVYKPTGLLVKKRPNYKGCLRIEMPKSITFFKKIIFWQSMLVEYYAKQ